MLLLIVASIAFVGLHFLLSHPLRAPIVAAIGETAFLGVYSLVALITLGGMAHAYAAMPPQAPLWAVGDLLWAIGTLVMLLASVLFVGALRGNPALPDPTGRPKAVPSPRGVFAITRHPMMWAFALWALVHAAVFPIPANLVLTAAILILALVGAALQDAKKRKLQPQFWPRWQAVTSYWPFGAIRAGTAQGAAAWPGALVWIGALVLWLVATWAHLPLAGWVAGIWRWVAI
ncbi:NnrU family protein [Stakelama tenebrarum]|uniref:MFS transporter n=1 Tax=Stakelama tenebrarum TaxID=2711215 RepID=A0A6G6Y0N4_9SPHN|nr:NnrU family protein [Sphingosinithalassobacter tenebrarum]QIG78367.1 MFS transporter [Sphingosinithalassobacter tenebrarum]